MEYCVHFVWLVYKQDYYPAGWKYTKKLIRRPGWELSKFTGKILVTFLFLKIIFISNPFKVCENLMLNGISI